MSHLPLLPRMRRLAAALPPAPDCQREDALDDMLRFGVRAPQVRGPI